MSSSATLSASVITAMSFIELPPVWVTLMLPFRHAHDQPVERLADLDLAGEAGIGFGGCGKAQHARLLRAGHRQPGLVEPVRVDIDVAGGTGAFAAAIGVDARDVVVDRTAHDRLSDRQFDRVLLAVVLDVGDLGHACSLAGLDASYQKPRRVRKISVA